MPKNQDKLKRIVRRGFPIALSTVLCMVMLHTCYYHQHNRTIPRKYNRNVSYTTGIGKHDEFIGAKDGSRQLSEFDNFGIVGSVVQSHDFDGDGLVDRIQKVRKGTIEWTLIRSRDYERNSYEFNRVDAKIQDLIKKYPYSE